MSALPPEQMRAMRNTARAAAQPVEALVKRWEELHSQSLQLATLANLADEKQPVEANVLTEMLNQATEWRRELAWQGIEDIDAMMQPGLTALRAITSRGQDAQSPALALWREFHAARNAVLSSLKIDHSPETRHAA